MIEFENEEDRQKQLQEEQLYKNRTKTIVLLTIGWFLFDIVIYLYTAVVAREMGGDIAMIFSLLIPGVSTLVVYLISILEYGLINKFTLVLYVYIAYSIAYLVIAIKTIVERFREKKRRKEKEKERENIII